ncbi:MAG TPA: GNAT family N-acetyltransferase [Acidimicrobiales bacterium]|nr:GNAT family N-acetyltransferase [Acidimicrobiales bacterium]
MLPSDPSLADPGIDVAGVGQRDQVLATLELAFASDPVMRWFWPQASVYRTYFARFVEAVAGTAFERGTALCLDGVRAVALWLPPGPRPDDDALVELMLESVDAAILEDLSAFADTVRELHPETDHWYLPFTGVDPSVQGRGLGSSLLRFALDICDRQGLPAYLEASTARSRALYTRHGFEEIGEIQEGSSPRVWAMLRAAS